MAIKNCFNVHMGMQMLLKINAYYLFLFFSFPLCVSLCFVNHCVFCCWLFKNIKEEKRKKKRKYVSQSFNITHYTVNKVHRRPGLNMCIYSARSSTLQSHAISRLFNL